MDAGTPHHQGYTLPLTRDSLTELAARIDRYITTLTPLNRDAAVKACKADEIEFCRLYLQATEAGVLTLAKFLRPESRAKILPAPPDASEEVKKVFAAIEAAQPKFPPVSAEDWRAVAFAAVEQLAPLPVATVSVVTEWTPISAGQISQAFLRHETHFTRLAEAAPRLASMLPEGATKSADAPPAPSIELITLDQAAAIVHRSKKTLERYVRQMPAPHVQGGGGKPSLWKWDDLRPWLEREFVPDLPRQFPANVR